MIESIFWSIRPIKERLPSQSLFEIKRGDIFYSVSGKAIRIERGYVGRYSCYVYNLDSLELLDIGIKDD